MQRTRVAGRLGILIQGLGVHFEPSRYTKESYMKKEGGLRKNGRRG